MPSATLLQKAYGNFSAEAIEPTLKSLCKGLKVQVRVKGKTGQGWVQVEVDGEDQSVALQLLNNDLGLAPINADKVERFSVGRGRIVDSGRDAAGLSVDIGVFAPKVVYAKIPLQSLQAQLADGKELPIQRLTELFCLIDYLPLQVKIVDTKFDVKDEVFVAELSGSQLVIFTDWLGSSLDRLLVLGAQSDAVERAVEASRHFRDIVRVESLGWLEHAVVCKLGTDAVGLIPAIGGFLRNATLAPFSPRKIRQMVDRSTL